MKYLIIALLILTQNAFAQKKIYLDKSWKETTQDKAHFYRILEKKSDSLYYIEDFYINGILQMSGHFSDLKKETFEGVMKWYDKDGKITVQKEYLHGKEMGLAIAFLPNGEILSKGEYKNGKPFNGTFTDECSCSFDQYKEGIKVKDVSFYLDSKQPSKEQYYNADNYPTKTIYYSKDNQILGTLYYSTENNYKEEKGVSFEFYSKNNRCVSIKSKTEFLNQQRIKTIRYAKDGTVIYEGTYKDDEPYDGYFFTNHTMTYYEKGIIQASVYVDENDNPSYEMIYENGKPYNGILKDYDELKTYKDGKLTLSKTYYTSDIKHIKEEITYNTNTKERTVKVYDKTGKLLGTSQVDSKGIVNGLTIDGNKIKQYKDSKLQWIEQADFTRENQLIHCDYKDEKPFDGILLDYQDRKYYKKGKLIKIDYTQLNYDTNKYNVVKTEFFDANKKTSKLIAYKDGKTYTCLFENGVPNNGIIHTDYEITNYKNGKKDGECVEYLYNIIVITSNYLNGIKEGKEIVSIDGSKTYVGNYQNGKPFSGTFYDRYSKSLIKYKNGLKYGKYTYTNKRNLPSFLPKITGIYKDGKPFSGKFITSKNNDLKIVSTYEKGKKDGVEYYETSFNVSDSLYYKKGKITHGKQLELLDGSRGGYYFTHYYEKGKKIKSQTGKTTIVYQGKNNFTITKKDPRNGYDKAQVTFTNKSQTEGEITYMKEDVSSGVFKFKNGRLTNGKLKMKVHSKKSDMNVTLQVKEERIFTTLKPLEKYKIYYEYSISNRITKTISFKNYEDILSVFFENASHITMNQYLNDGTFLASFISEKAIGFLKPSGVMISFDEKDGTIIYNLRIFKDGKSDKINNLSYDEMLETVKKINKK